MQLDLYSDTPNDAYTPRFLRDPFAPVIPTAPVVVPVPANVKTTKPIKKAAPQPGDVPQVVNVANVADMGDVGDWLFCDGGVISRNPSTIGGTWAWVLVKDGAEVARDSGVINPEFLERNVVTNNNTELYALCQGINKLSDGWAGKVASDSGIALGWVFRGFKTDLVPHRLMIYRSGLEAVRKRADGLPWVNLAGHPMPSDLAAGKRLSKTPNLPVSKWNVLCDALCSQAGRDYLAVSGK